MRRTGLLAGLLLAAPALACTDDGGSSDDGDSTETGDTDTGDDGTDTDTGDDGGECIPPPADAEAFGPQQYVTLVNNQAGPIWIKGGDCGAAWFTLEVDGEVWRDNVALFEHCTDLVANDYCPGACAPEDGILPSLRIGAGEDFLVPFDGRAFAAHPVAASCSDSDLCPAPERCEVLSRVPEGASLTLTVEAFGSCSGMGCDCEDGQTCELAMLNVFSGIAGASGTGTVTFSYPDAGYPELAL